MSNKRTFKKKNFSPKNCTSVFSKTPNYGYCDQNSQKVLTDMKLKSSMTLAAPAFKQEDIQLREYVTQKGSD